MVLPPITLVEICVGLEINGYLRPNSNFNVLVRSGPTVCEMSGAAAVQSRAEIRQRSNLLAGVLSFGRKHGRWQRPASIESDPDETARFINMKRNPVDWALLAPKLSNLFQV